MNAARMGFVGHHRKAGGGEKVLGDRAPQIPQGFQRGVTFAFDEGLWVQAQQFAEFAQELCGAVQANGRLQIRPLQGHVDFGTDALHQTSNFSQIAG